MRTAAELGFDDSRYEEHSADSAQLDPVGRSLMREERRAALEAQAGSERPPFPQQQEPQQQYSEAAYEEAPYAADQYAQEPQAGGRQEQQYEQPSYEGTYDPYRGDTGYAEQPGYSGQAGYQETAYPAPQAPQAAYDEQYSAQPQQEEWADQSTYQGPYEPVAQAETESVASAPTSTQESVGFDRSGPVPNSGHELTGAGLPRRGGQQHWQPTGRGNDQPVAAQQAPPQQEELPQQQPSPAQEDGAGSEDWRSANDERWERAEKLREPKAGGVTLSGLPRRVPKANLVEGTAEQTQQGGPQVSRAPEDIRGRLSNLRRGVLRGRNAGSDTSNTYNQER